MAFRLSWTAAVLAGGALVVALALNARLPGRWRGSQPAAAGEHYYQVLRATRAEVQKLREAAEWSAVQPLLPPGPGLTITVQPPYPASWADSIRGSVQRELTDTGGLRARVGVFVMPAADLGPGTSRVQAWSLYHLHASTEPGPTCVVIVSEAQPRVDERSRTALFRTAYFTTGPGWMVRPQVLRGCRFWARYGAPGSRVEQWFERRGHQFATATGEPGPTASEATRRYRLFGRRSPDWPEVRSALACHQGDRTACLAFFLEAGTHTGAGGFPRELIGPADATLLSTLEQEFGADAFARFWHSGADVASAFEDAFAVPLTDWLRRWLERTYGPASGGAGVSFATAALSLLAAGALFGAALAAAHRRTA